MILIHRRYPSMSTAGSILMALIVALGVILSIYQAASAADREWLQGSQEITLEKPDGAAPVIYHAFVVDLALGPDWRLSYVWEQAYQPAWPIEQTGLEQNVSVTWYPGGSVYFVTAGHQWRDSQGDDWPLDGVTYIILGKGGDN